MIWAVYYWGWVPCLAIGILVGHWGLRRVGTMWATVPLAILLAFLWSSVYVRLGITEYFGWCGTGRANFAMRAYLSLGVIGVTVTQCGVLVGDVYRRYLSHGNESRKLGSGGF